MYPRSIVALIPALSLFLAAAELPRHALPTAALPEAGSRDDADSEQSAHAIIQQSGISALAAQC